MGDGMAQTSLFGFGAKLPLGSSGKYRRVASEGEIVINYN